MAKWVVAINLKFGCYSWFRILDTETNTTQDIPALLVLKQMEQVKDKLIIENLKLNSEHTSFKFICCDDSRMCYLTDDGQPKVNKDGILVVDIDGEFATIANWEGKTHRTHMLNIAKWVRNKNYVLCNAELMPNGRIIYKQPKGE